MLYNGSAEVACRFAELPEIPKERVRQAFDDQVCRAVLGCQAGWKTVAPVFCDHPPKT